MTIDHHDAGPGLRTREPLVGRAAEWAELDSALASMQTGRGALMLIAGDAGIGKTRLAEAVADEAAGGAAPCSGAARGRPAGRRVLALDPGPARAAGRPAGGRGGGGPRPRRARTPRRSRPSSARWLRPGRPRAVAGLRGRALQAFDATASFLRASAARRPIVIVLDDLHAADVASVRLLEFLARGVNRARILAVGTYRTAEARRDTELAAALGDLGKAGGGSCSAGSRATRSASSPSRGRRRRRRRSSSSASTSSPRATPVRGRAHAAACGRGRAHGRPGPCVSGRLPLPEGVRETIRRRLDPLEPAVAEALAAAAVIGPEFRLETLERVLARDRAALIEQLDEAAEAGLVEELPRAVGPLPLRARPGPGDPLRGARRAASAWPSTAPSGRRSSSCTATGPTRRSASWPTTSWRPRPPGIR